MENNLTKLEVDMIKSQIKIMELVIQMEKTTLKMNIYLMIFYIILGISIPYAFLFAIMVFILPIISLIWIAKNVLRLRYYNKDLKLAKKALESLNI